MRFNGEHCSTATPIRCVPFSISQFDKFPKARYEPGIGNNAKDVCFENISRQSIINCCLF
jgi:hypothetical protein